MKIKHIKDKPLLEEVGKARWWEVTPADERNMKKFLERSRESRGKIYGDLIFPAGHAIGWIHYFMRGLGLDVEVTEEDMKAMLEQLEEGRVRNSGPTIARMHHLLGEFGNPQEITQQDREKAMIAQLKGYNRERDGAGITTMLYHMKLIGLNQTPTEEDKEAMRKGLAISRQNLSPGYVLCLHHMMRELGVGEEVTKNDIRRARENLEERRRRKDGLEIAEALYYLRVLKLVPQETDKPEKMPPLKEFAGK